MNFSKLKPFTFNNQPVRLTMISIASLEMGLTLGANGMECPISLSGNQWKLN